MQFSLLPPCRHVVLDEADQMLERGFAESVEEILAASFGESKSTKVTCNVHVHTWSAVAEMLMIKISLVPPLLNTLPVLSYERHLVVMLWATVTGFAGISVTLGL